MAPNGCSKVRAISRAERTCRLLWTSSYKEGQKIFGFPIQISHQDIATLFEAVGVVLGEGQPHFIMPRDPLKRLNVENAVVCDGATRRYLTATWRTNKDPKTYARGIEALTRLRA